MLRSHLTRALLALIAVLLVVVLIRPTLLPPVVYAQPEVYPFYVEPGFTTIRKPDGSLQTYGKVMIDMRNGDAWGFPTVAQQSYPVDTTKTTPPKSYPVYLGQFVFSEAKHQVSLKQDSFGGERGRANDYARPE